MNAFVEALKNDTVTENGMAAYKSTMSACVDFFYKAGASRGKDLYQEWKFAAQENLDVAIRLLFWARDVRGGAGEREVFRKILLGLESDAVLGNVLAAEDVLTKIISKIPEYGRVDDLFVFTSTRYKTLAAGEWWLGLNNPKTSGNFGKWSPRKGPVAEFLRKYVALTPKQYRQRIVAATNVVETHMCSKKWNEIEFSKVPSLAMTRYTKAFNRNAPEEFSSFKEKLTAGETKVNAGAIYPYDLIKTVLSGAFDEVVTQAQWDSLPNYVGSNNFLPVVDVSGSMDISVAGQTTALNVALSLGIYLAERNTGAFKDMFVTFSSRPEIQFLKGKNLAEKVNNLNDAAWEMNTNLEAVFQKVLDVAVRNKVRQEDMPDSILILSDMAFDQATRYNRNVTSLEMIRSQYVEAGYKVPTVVYWNLNDKGNTPATVNEMGVALVSGFSPSLMKSLLLDPDVTPEKAMLSVIMVPRYDNIFS